MVVQEISIQKKKTAYDEGRNCSDDCANTNGSQVSS